MTEQQQLTATSQSPLVLSQLTPERKAKFLEALVLTGGNVTASAECAGVSRQNAYQWRVSDKEFALAWDEQIEHGTENLEEMAYKRAMSVSDTLAIFLLKSRRPEKYRENIKLDAETMLTADNIKDIGESLLLAMRDAAQRKMIEEPQGQVIDVTPE